MQTGDQIVVSLDENFLSEFFRIHTYDENKKILGTGSDRTKR